MYSVILGPREHHNAPTEKAYRRIHAQAIAKKKRNGWRVEVHVVKEPVVARIDFGNWITDCECGAGNAVDPEWGVALCFGCGAVHETVVFPSEKDRVAIEALLTARPAQKNRGWTPGEAVADLEAENVAHEVQRVADVGQEKGRL